MKVLFVNPAWDAAGVSYRQARGINKYTDWSARHFREVPTFYAGSDITSENYNIDEFVSIIRESDIIHFCSAIHTYPCRMKWGFDWEKELKGKIKIFHDYCSFPGHWRDRAEKKDYWNKLEDIKYDAIFSSIPQAVHIYKDLVYVPDFVEELSEEFAPPYQRNFDKVVACHFPTGDPNNKNTTEFTTAINIAQKSAPVTSMIKRGISNPEVIKSKKTANIGFDALWREYHGMTTVENLALGIPTMCNISSEFDVVFNEYFQIDMSPFENTKDTQGIADCLIKYANDLPMLETRSNEVREFMTNKWSAKNISNNIVNEYKKLLERKSY